MVLSLKRWKSRTPPGFAASAQEQNPFTCLLASAGSRPALADPGPHRPLGDAGWSSPVARQAHNLKVTGSNPVPATTQNTQTTPTTGCGTVHSAQAKGRPDRKSTRLN